MPSSSLLFLQQYTQPQWAHQCNPTGLNGDTRPAAGTFPPGPRGTHRFQLQASSPLWRSERI
ncbi:hypothetical protein EYF80_058298 [Liparis tanakae]|uniref:Uncharacterized protein n=1 Tax=Liparis tanakae TaxID=230148 RepID=A0A4Z2ESE5_9TELE|nr:hypothetical protein EYF80_058298 [Liparis tanakae]